MGASFWDHGGNFVVDVTQRQQATMSMVEGEVWAPLHACHEGSLVWIGFSLEATYMCWLMLFESGIIVSQILVYMLLCVNFEVKFVGDKRI
jgi:hypothetical protein